jgi:dynein heavy chain, axonemal
MSDCEFFRVEVAMKYGVAEWRDDLRRLLRRVGLDCQPTVFLFGDHQVKHISFLEDINYLLNAADIPNLFEHEERLQIIDRMQQVALQEGIEVEQTPVNMYNLFLQRIHNNLHLIITLSPIGDNFRIYIRQFPSLTSCCVVDWFTVRTRIIAVM